MNNDRKSNAMNTTGLNEVARLRAHGLISGRNCRNKATAQTQLLTNVQQPASDLCVVWTCPLGSRFYHLFRSSSAFSFAYHCCLSWFASVHDCTLWILHEKGLQRQLGVGTLVRNQERRAAIVPRIKSGVIADKPQVNRTFCSSIGLHKVSYTRIRYSTCPCI